MLEAMKGVGVLRIFVASGYLSAGFEAVGLVTAQGLCGFRGRYHGKRNALRVHVPKYGSRYLAPQSTYMGLLHGHSLHYLGTWTLRDEHPRTH